MINTYTFGNYVVFKNGLLEYLYEPQFFLKYMKERL
jgi:hypothetical protein